MSRVFIFCCFLFSSYLNADTVKNGKFCSDDGDLCIKAVLAVDDSRGLVTLNGRVTKSTREGYLKMTLYGYADDDRVFVAYVQGRLKGKYSEIIDMQNGASRNSDTRWVLKRFSYQKLSN